MLWSRWMGSCRIPLHVVRCGLISLSSSRFDLYGSSSMYSNKLFIQNQPATDLGTKEIWMNEDIWILCQPSNTEESKARVLCPPIVKSLMGTRQSVFQPLQIAFFPVWLHSRAAKPCSQLAIMPLSPVRVLTFSFEGLQRTLNPK